MQRVGIQRGTAAGFAVILGGYAGLFVAVVAIFFILAAFTALNVVAMLAAFLVVFSGLLAWSVYRLMSKQRTAPPSAGASGV